jgi:hypothetical protein
MLVGLSAAGIAIGWMGEKDGRSPGGPLGRRRPAARGRGGYTVLNRIAGG